MIPQPANNVVIMPREEEAGEETDTLPAEDDRLVASLHRSA